jgi:hypothetical protein
MRILVVVCALLAVAAVACGGSSGSGSDVQTSANSGGGGRPVSSGREGNNCIFTNELAEHDGDSVMLCGVVEEGVYNAEQKRNTTLFMDGPQGSETARVVLEGAIRSGFLTPPEERFGASGTMICAQGKVSIVDGIPRVFVNNMQNIVFLKELVVTGDFCNGAGTN